MQSDIKSYRVVNILLIFCFLFVRGIDYTTTYIMLSLGSVEANVILNALIEHYGVLKGLIIAAIPTYLIVLGLFIIVLRVTTFKLTLFVSVILSILIFLTLIVSIGNISGLALVVHKVIGS